jgi:hypothetical protein
MIINNLAALNAKHVIWSTIKNESEVNNNNDNNNETKVMPVIIGATGTISKSLIKYLSSIPGKHDIKELQKTALLGTVHILQKVIM